MTDFGTVGFGTLEPGLGEFEEQISFTGVTQNANGTATLTGVKTVLFIAPYTQTSGLAKTHAGSTVFVISNTAGFYDTFTNKNDNESITQVWTFDTLATPLITDQPTTALQAVNKGFLETGVYNYYVDTGAADALVITPVPALGAYIAGDKFAVKVAVTNTGATTINVSALGVKSVVKSASSALVAGDIVAGQIIILQYDGTNFQIVAGIGSVSGASNASTTVKGIVEEATQAEVNAGTAVGGTGARLFVNPSTLAITDVQIFTSNGTWTKPGIASVVQVICIGGGGSGGGAEGTNAGSIRGAGTGGGGGVITIKTFRASDLGATETITVATAAAGGAGGNLGVGTAGASGGVSSFGTFLTAYGGGAGGRGGSNQNGGSGGGSGSVGVASNSSAILGGSPALTAAIAGISGQGAGSLAAGTTPPVGLPSEYGGGSGGASSTDASANSAAAGGSLFGGSGGGAGGTINAANTERTSSAGGAYNTFGSAGGGAAGATAGGAGGAGTSRSGFGAGDGGGGGGPNTAATGGIGGAGGAPGGGGGGGGGGTNTGGAGGAGGRGEVRVYSW